MQCMESYDCTCLHFTHTHAHLVVAVKFEQPLYTVPETNGIVTVCLESNTETKMDLEVIVTTSERSPVDAEGIRFTCSHFHVY